MNKKVFFIVTSVIIFSLIIYKIILNTIGDAVDDANKRGIEEYVSAIRLAYANSILHDNNINDIDSIDIKITTKVECEEKSITKDGTIELHGCRVEDSKTKYGYVNSKVVKE